MARRTKKTEEKPMMAEGTPTLGTRLCKAREARGLSVEEVSRMIRLRPKVIRELENDDFTSFSHATYARMAILGYARLLGVPEEEVRDWLPPKGELGSSEFTYLDRMQDPEPAARREDFASQRKPPQSPLQILLRLIFLLGLIAFAAYALVFFTNIARIGQGGAPVQPTVPAPDSDTSAPQSDAVPRGAQLSVPSRMQLVPEGSPTPFLEKDALALDLQIHVAAPEEPTDLEETSPAPENSDGTSTATPAENQQTTNNTTSAPAASPSPLPVRTPLPPTRNR